MNAKIFQMQRLGNYTQEQIAEKMGLPPHR